MGNLHVNRDHFSSARIAALALLVVMLQGCGPLLSVETGSAGAGGGEAGPSHTTVTGPILVSVKYNVTTSGTGDLSKYRRLEASCKVGADPMQEEGVVARLGAPTTETLFTDPASPFSPIKFWRYEFSRRTSSKTEIFPLVSVDTDNAEKHSLYIIIRNGKVAYCDETPPTKPLTPPTTQKID